MAKRTGGGDGFIRADYEWFASLLTAGLNALEQVVLLEVVLQCHGWSKRASATLSPSEIGERIGQDRSNVNRAIRGLCQRGILAKLADGTYRFEPDYSRWRLGEDPARRTARLGYVASAPRLAKMHGPPVEPTAAPDPRDPQLQLPFREPPGEHPAGPPPAPDVTGPDAQRGQIRPRSVVNSDHKRGQIRPRSVVNSDHTGDVPPTPPIGERGRELRIKKEREPFFKNPPPEPSGPDPEKKDLAPSGRLTPAERAARFAALKLHHEG